VRRAGQLVVGVALIIDGLTGYRTDLAAIVVGLVLVGALSVEGVAALLERRPPR
jgi:hypothetical protein